MRAPALAFLGLILIPGTARSAGWCGTREVHPASSFAGGTDCSIRPAMAMIMSSVTRPIRVHYDSQDASMASVVLTAAETSWNFQTVAMGLPEPLADSQGGDSAFDIYVERSPIGGGYFCPDEFVADATGSRYNGFVSVDPGDWDSATMPPVVAHELNHAIQFAVDGLEDPAFMEMTSAYVMDKTFPEIDLAASFISYFQARPGASLDFFEYSEPYQYGASLFLFWLVDDVFNGDYESLSYLWLAAQQPYDAGAMDYNEPDFFDTLTALAEGSDRTLDGMYADFAAARWFTGSHDDGTFAAGETYDDVAADATWSLSFLPENPIQVDTPVSEYGAAYIEVTTNGAEGILTFTLDAPTTKTWTVMVLRPGKSGRDRDELALDAQGVGTVDIAGADHVVFVVANLGDGTHDPDDDDWVGTNFDYSITRTGGEKDPSACGCDLSRAPSSRNLTSLALALIPAGLFLRRRRR